MGGINYYGNMSLHLFNENLNSERYIRDLRRFVTWIKWDIYRKNYMQMDNARIHRTLDALRFYKENNIVVIDWPAYSPDRNPIENVWAYIKGKLSGNKIISIKQIETEIIKIWESIPKIQIEKTCESIYERIGDCIKMKGGLTNY